MSPRRSNPKRWPRAYGPLLLLVFASCKIQETGLAVGEPGTPIAPATAAPAASDGGSPTVVVPPPAPGPPPPADAGVKADRGAPGTTPPAPPTSPHGPTTTPQVPPVEPSDAGVPTVVADAMPAVPPSPIDAVPMPPAAPRPDTCAPSSGSPANAQVVARVRGAEDFAFDNGGELLLFQNHELLRLDSKMRPSILGRNPTGLVSGTLHVMPDGDLLIAETSHDHILRIDPMGRRPETTTMELQSPLRIAPALASSSVYVTSSTDAIILLNATTGQAKTVDQLDYRPAGIAIDRVNKKLYVGAANRGVIYAYDVGQTGALSGRTIAVNQIPQPNALLVDDCGGLYIGGTDGGDLRRRAPDGALSVIARFEGPNITTLAFGSGKHGWSDKSLFALDTSVGTLYEVQVRK